MNSHLLNPSVEWSLGLQDKSHIRGGNGEQAVTSHSVCWPSRSKRRWQRPVHLIPAGPFVFEGIFSKLVLEFEIFGITKTVKCLFFPDPKLT